MFKKSLFILSISFFLFNCSAPKAYPSIPMSPFDLTDAYAKGELLDCFVFMEKSIPKGYDSSWVVKSKSLGERVGIQYTFYDKDRRIRKVIAYLNVAVFFKDPKGWKQNLIKSDYCYTHQTGFNYFLEMRPVAYGGAL